MPKGEIICWKALVTTTSTQAEASDALAAASITYESGSDNSGNHLDSEDNTVVFLSGNTLRTTSKSSTYSTTYLLRWKLVEEDMTATDTRSVIQGSSLEREGHLENAPRLETWGAIFKHMKQLDIQQKKNTQLLFDLFGHLQRQVSALQVTVASSNHIHIDQERARHISEIKSYLSYKLRALLRRSLSRRCGYCETEFSSILQRHQMDMKMQCSLRQFTHIVKDVCHNVKIKNTSFLPSLAAANGAIGGQKHLYIAFAQYDSLLRWLVVIEGTEVAAYENYVQNRSDGCLARMVADLQWNKSGMTQALKFFIGSTCVKDAAHILEQHTTKRLPIVRTDMSSWDVANDIFLESFTGWPGWTNFNEISSETFCDYDAIYIKWTALETSRTSDRNIAGFQLCEVTLSVPTIIVVGCSIWEKIRSTGNSEN